MKKGEEVSSKDNAMSIILFFGIVFIITIGKYLFFNDAEFPFMKLFFQSFGEFVIYALVGCIVSFLFFKQNSKAKKIYIGLIIGFVIFFLFIIIG